MICAKKVLICFLIFHLCPATWAQSVSFESKTFIKKNGEKNMLELKENEIITLKPGDTILAQNKLGFPILIYAAQSPQTTILVSNADIENSMQLQMQPEVEKRTSEIIDEIRKVENFIQKRDYIQASSTIASLKLKNKNISSILFLSGTVNYLTNNKSLAIEDLQSGLQIDPSNGPAKKLLEKLRGNL